jgi:plastocyanin domain-containing protein
MKKYLWVFLFSAGLFTGPGWAADHQEFIASVDKDGIQRVEVIGGSYFFNPAYIVLKVNVPVEMRVSKESGVIPHDLIIQAPEAGMDIKVELNTEPQTVKFTPSKIGKYPFYCSKKVLFFGSHRDKGMVGTIEVKE